MPDLMLSCRTVSIATVVCFIALAYLYYYGKYTNNNQNSSYTMAENDMKLESKKCSIKTTLGHKELIKQLQHNEQKINANGEYRQFCGFTIVSMCQVNELKYLEEFIVNSQMLRKIISPLPYTSYHMTTYGISSPSSCEPIKFVQDWLREDSTRKIDDICIPPTDVYPIMNSAQRVWDDTGSSQFTVRTNCLEFGNDKDHLRLWVQMNDEELGKMIVRARLQCDTIFDKTSQHDHHLHITLGYVFSKAEDLSYDERVKFEQELIQLEEILPDNLVMNPPKVSSFQTMKEFLPVIK